MAVLVFPSTQKNDVKESRFEKCQFNVSFIMNTGTDDIRELSVTIVVVAGQNDAERQSEWMRWASQYFFAHVIRHYKFHSFGAAGRPVSRVDHSGESISALKGYISRTMLRSVSACPSKLKNPLWHERQRAACPLDQIQNTREREQGHARKKGRIKHASMQTTQHHNNIFVLHLYSLYLPSFLS